MYITYMPVTFSPQFLTLEGGQHHAECIKLCIQNVIFDIVILMITYRTYTACTVIRTT